MNDYRFAEEAEKEEEESPPFYTNPQLKRRATVPEDEETEEKLNYFIQTEILRETKRDSLKDRAGEKDGFPVSSCT